ncbi:MAG: addiction module protein [Rhodoferax sp.]|nr:addiction module protein [Rhodoferax sp.]
MEKPYEEMDSAWAEEAVQRARACDEGRMKTLTFEEVFGNQCLPRELPEGIENDE